MATCPVCKANVDEAKAKASSGLTSGGAHEVDPAAGTRQFHDGKWFYFDTLECRSKFNMAPASYT